jgi:ubiquinone/menaquinone biosynthesis C-methylase UbiE
LIEVSPGGLDRVRRFYDRDPEGYHRGMTSPVSEWLLGGRRSKVGEAVRGRVLDIGFGTGLSVPHYAEGVEIIGIDASEPMLRFGRRFAGRSGRQVRLAAMDAEHLAFTDNTFDSVAFNLCLCTIPDPAAAVAEALRVARPGAPMVFLEHVRSHLFPVGLFMDAMNPVMVALEADHFNRRTEATVRAAGVKVDSVERWALGVFNLIVGHAPHD